MRLSDYFNMLRTGNCVALIDIPDQVKEVDALLGVHRSTLYRYAW